MCYDLVYDVEYRELVQDKKLKVEASLNKTTGRQCNSLYI